jgi:ethanolamine utilization protein EutN
MLVGRVVGQVWATKKQETLQGIRFLLVSPLALSGAGKGEAPGTTFQGQAVVAADTIGAGIGETVIVAFGRAARTTIGRGQDVGYQVAVVGIVDEIQLEGGKKIEA